MKRFAGFAIILICAATVLTGSFVGRSSFGPSLGALSSSRDWKTAVRKDGEPARNHLVKDYGKLPLRFEANLGQTDTAVDFLAHGSGYTLFLTPEEAVLRLRRTVSPTGHNTPSVVEEQDDLSADLGLARWRGRSASDPARLHTASRSDVVRMKLVGSNPAAQMQGQDELASNSNYFLGNQPANWRNSVPNFGSVRYDDVYPGIDLLYYGNQGQVEFDFEIAPGANPAAIRMTLDGATKVTPDDAGNLAVEVRAGRSILLRRPTVYQRSAGQRTEVAGRFALDAGDNVRFELGHYDATRPLVIDPVLVYSTFWGGATEDSASAVAVDASGSAYFTGLTDSVDFPVTAPFQGALVGSDDIFITKLNPSGTAVVYSTYLGGGSSDEPTGIAVDSSGTAFLTGLTSSPNFPVLNALQPDYGGGDSDAFVIRLNAAGAGIIFSTYLGGSGAVIGDFGQAIALDSSGNAYVSGTTDSINFPTTATAFNHTLGFVDSFLTKINPTGTTLLYSTYYGAGPLGVTFGGGVAVDAAGDAFIAGTVFGGALSTMTPFQAAAGGGNCSGIPCPDAFVAKFNPAGTALLYSTYLGGNVDDEAYAIGVDASGSAVITGFTSSSNFPLANPLQGAKGANFDAFVTHLAPSGSSLVYSTFMGGGGSEGGFGIAVRPDGTAFVAGQTGSNAFPVLNAIQSTRSGSFDAFVSSLTPAGALNYSTYLGGTTWENAFGIAVDGSGNAYIVGETESANFPTTNPLQSSYKGGVCGGASPFPCDDAFIAKIGDVTNPVPATTFLSPSVAAAGGFGLTLTVNGTGFVASSVVRWNDSSRTTTFVSSTKLTAAIPPADIVSLGTVQVTVFTPSPGGGTSNSLLFTIATTVPDNPLPMLTSIAPQGATTGAASTTLTATGSNFIPESVIRWNGADRTTTFISTTQLTTTLAAGDLAAPATAQVTVFNPTPGGGSSAALPFAITLPPPVPTFVAAGLVNGASFGGPPPAAGEIVTLFGTNLATAQALFNTVPLPTSLGGTSLRLNGVSAPLLFVSSTQINFLIPWELAGQLAASMIVTNTVGSSTPVNVNLSLIAPAVFTLNQQGSGQGAVLISNTAFVAAPAGSIPGTSSRAVNRGEFITIYCTGLGNVTNPPQSGAAASTSPPFSQTTSTPTVSIGGVQASPSFSGLAPGFVGLYQIDVQVPASAPTGNAVQLTVSLNGVTANNVTIAVQ